MRINYKKKNNDNIETCILSKINSKVARNKKTEFVKKITSSEKYPPEKSTNFHEIQRNMHDSENDNNGKNPLPVKNNKIKNNNNEDNRLSIHGNKIENANSENTVTGDRMVKDVDGYVLTGSIIRKFIVKVRLFSSAKTIGMEGYTKPT